VTSLIVYLQHLYFVIGLLNFCSATYYSIFENQKNNIGRRVKIRFGGGPKTRLLIYLALVFLIISRLTTGYVLMSSYI